MVQHAVPILQWKEVDAPSSNDGDDATDTDHRHHMFAHQLTGNFGEKMATNRPEFRKARAHTSYSSAEDLFARLPNRTKSHGYLRQPQADVLRQYHKSDKRTDIALELPTGTGKTVVGLLIAEWKRRQTGSKVAFLTVTNQLARQVLREAERLGIECADLIGDKDTRDAAQVGLYKTGRALAVSTYSNLFNVNPVIQASEVLIFDDAHGGEQVAAEMWTVRVDARKNKSTYLEALTAIRSALTDAQFRVITDEASHRSMELADLRMHAEAMETLTRLLDGDDEPRIKWPWTRIRNHLDACLVLISSGELVIRPLVPPTHTHAAFADSRQRIYMSATLGGESDLQRGYGIETVTTIRAEHAQWGKRYIFMPELYFEEDEAWRIVASVWEAASPQRALVLAPSAPSADAAFENIATHTESTPQRLGKQDIEDSLDPFTSSTGSLLCLAGRYDGIDLPGDDCRILVIADTPSAVGPMERHLREHWKLGPILRRRERTRLIQGMGRCTRDATDYAVIFLLGRALIDSVTASAMLTLLPGEIQREIRWGIEQSEASRDDEHAIEKMAVGLLDDRKYRRDANENLSELDIPEEQEDPLANDECGLLEVRFSRALWSRDLTNAYEVARQAADTASGAELAGYRAWWLYLASIPAGMQDDLQAELDCLRRARSIGINAGYLDHLLRMRGAQAAAGNDEQHDVEAEAIWQAIDNLGWQGPSFGRSLDEMTTRLEKFDESTTFHRGLEQLGRCLGAEVMRPTEAGAPDMVWIFEDRVYTFEAKSTARLSKKYVLQAKGHPDWVRAKRPDLQVRAFQPVVVSPDREVDQVAKPFAGNLNHVNVSDVTALGERASSSLRSIRAKFVGKDYGIARQEFKAALKAARIDRGSIDAFCSVPLLES